MIKNKYNPYHHPKYENKPLECLKKLKKLKVSLKELDWVLHDYNL